MEHKKGNIVFEASPWTAWPLKMAPIVVPKRRFCTILRYTITQKTEKFSSNVKNNLLSLPRIERRIVHHIVRSEVNNKELELSYQAR
jgi:hypothetical protein